MQKIVQERGCGFVLLLDPDKLPFEHISQNIEFALNAGVDVFLVGGSYLLDEQFHTFVQEVKRAAGDNPVIIFPGSLQQVSSHADAILYLSVISGRNPEHLIGSQVIAAPLVWKMKLEAISCGYMLIESGALTSAQFLSNSFPIPRAKPDIALAHALAAQYLGMKTIYLEAGSGAKLTVPEEMVQAVSKNVEIPVFVGGGIRTPEEARRKASAGASFVVIGNYFENSDNYALMREFARAIHNEI